MRGHGDRRDTTKHQVWQNPRLSPAIVNGHCVNILPCSLDNAHRFQLVNLIHMLGGNSTIKTIHSSAIELSPIKSFKTPNDTSLIRLELSSIIQHESLHFDVRKVVRGYMHAKIILEQENVTAFLLQFLVPVREPFLIELDRHPSQCVAAIVNAKFCRSLAKECARACYFTDDERRKFLATIGIDCESVSENSLASKLFVHAATIRRHSVEGLQLQHPTLTFLWSCLAVSLQPTPLLQPFNPPRTQPRSLLLTNLFQIRKLHPHLPKHLTANSSPTHSLRNPQLNHSIHIWKFRLLSPLLPPIMALAL
ncbi:hypothetical protein BDQ17DRAFT_1346802 [Cyathus striatus]|nr:hypothetical protein BDQ17DRAFT_1346802 [Cyathus striatus]